MFNKPSGPLGIKRNPFVTFLRRLTQKNEDPPLITRQNNQLSSSRPAPAKIDDAQPGATSYPQARNQTTFAPPDQLVNIDSLAPSPIHRLGAGPSSMPPSTKASPMAEATRELIEKCVSFAPQEKKAAIEALFKATPKHEGQATVEAVFEALSHLKPSLHKNEMLQYALEATNGFHGDLTLRDKQLWKKLFPQDGLNDRMDYYPEVLSKIIQNVCEALSDIGSNDQKVAILNEIATLSAHTTPPFRQGLECPDYHTALIERIWKEIDKLPPDQNGRAKLVRKFDKISISVLT